MAVIQLTKSNFAAEVLQSDKPVLIDFYADWCRPCKLMAPIISELSEESTNYKVCKLNVSDVPELATQYNVNSIPTLVVLKEGKVVEQAVGTRSKDFIRDMLK